MPDTQPPESLDDALRRKAREAEMADNLAILRGQPTYKAAFDAAWAAAERNPPQLTDLAQKGAPPASLRDAVSKGTVTPAELAAAEAQEAYQQKMARAERKAQRDAEELKAAGYDRPRDGIIRGYGYVDDTNTGRSWREEEQVGGRQRP